MKYIEWVQFISPYIIKLRNNEITSQEMKDIILKKLEKQYHEIYPLDITGLSKNEIKKLVEQYEINLKNRGEDDTIIKSLKKR